MSAKVERDGANPAPANAVPSLGTSAAVLPIADGGDERWGGHALPSDHPAWLKDTLSVSQRARALLTKLKPVVVRVLTYWEHTVRSITCNGRRLSIDASGSYRLD